jgi:hypothetical protein
MSDTNTDTNDDAIKKKKNQSAGKTDVGGFIKNFALSMVGIILFIIFGTSWLYIAKLSTAKIIPINTLYEPYTCEKNTSIGKDDENHEIKVPMNTMSELDFKGLKFWGEPIGKWEQEATFASQGFIKSFNHSFISNLRKKTDNPASASNYDIFKSILVNNVIGTGFWLYDKVSIPDGIRMMPDSLKIVIYGLFGVMFFPFFWIWNGAASVYYTIKTLSSSQQTSPENPNDGGYDGGLFDGVDALKNGDSLFSNFGKAILRFFVWIPIWLIVIPVLSMFVFPAIGTFYPFFKMLFSAGYKLKEYDAFKPNKQSDSKSFLDFIKDNLVYKRTLILVFAILNLFTCTNTYLGENYFTAVVLATIIAVVFGNIFVNSEPDDVTMISVKETVEPVLEKPASLDDECEEYQDKVIEAWQMLKQSNESVDDLIYDYPGYSQKGELKKMKKHIIEQFKKLDGKQPLDNVMVTNYDIASPDNTIPYTRLYSEYTKFIDSCKVEARQEEAAKEQAAKEEGEKAQAAQAAQVKADRIAGGNVVSAMPSPATTSSSTTSTNNNNSATGGGTRPQRLVETQEFVVENPLAKPRRGKNTVPMTDTGNNNSSSAAVKQTNLASNIEESPVQLGENRPSAETPGVKTNPVKIEKEELQNFIGARASPIAPSGGSRSSPVAAGGSFGLNPSAVTLLENVGRDNKNGVETELPKLDKQDITEILEVYRRDVGKIPMDQQEINKIARIQKYLPMIIERQRQLNGEKPLSEDEMNAYIRKNFPTAAETGRELGDAISKLDDEELARTKAAKTGGGNPNPQPQLPAGDSKQSFAFPPLPNADPGKVMTEVMNAVSNKIEMNKNINLTVLPIDVLNSQVTKATRDFVNTKGPPNRILYNNMNLLLNEKYRRDGKSNEVDAEVNRILAQQTLPVLMTGGSKNKQKTLKNRRQRFNIRLV